MLKLERARIKKKKCGMLDQEVNSIKTRLGNNQQKPS